MPCAMAKAHDKALFFAMCQGSCTRQIMSRATVLRASLPCAMVNAHGKEPVPRVPENFAEGQKRHTANSLPCAREVAHDKGALCRRLVAVCPLPCAAHGKPFAVGFWGLGAHGNGGVSRSDRFHLFFSTASFLLFSSPNSIRSEENPTWHS